MNRLTLLAIGALLFAAPAHAVVINLGSFATPPGGDSAANELAFLNSTVLPAYNAANNPDLPAALAGSQNVDVSGNMLSITFNATGYEFVKLKWGQNWQFYYVAGEGSLTFQSTTFNQNGQPQALSHYTFFNSTLAPEGPGPGVGVPEGGTTALLLGLAVLGLGFFRRFLS
jgi:hypothetical protein